MTNQHSSVVNQQSSINNEVMTKQGFTIRRMTSNDLEEVHAIETNSSLTPWSKNMFIDEMAHPYAHCFVMTSPDSSQGRVMGFICFRNIGDESELINLCVHPGDRHRGLGRELMQFYTAFCIHGGMKTFHLEVNHANRPALQLYRSFSYQSVALRPKFYRGECDALRMIKRV
jgi:[ribosomal protein S18]-alanine N-acetyltransferase